MNCVGVCVLLLGAWGWSSAMARCIIKRILHVENVWCNFWLFWFRFHHLILSLSWWSVMIGSAILGHLRWYLQMLFSVYFLWINSMAHWCASWTAVVDSLTLLCSLWLLFEQLRLQYSWEVLLFGICEQFFCLQQEVLFLECCIIWNVGWSIQESYFTTTLYLNARKFSMDYREWSFLYICWISEFQNLVFALCRNAQLIYSSSLLSSFQKLL